MASNRRISLLVAGLVLFTACAGATLAQAAGATAIPYRIEQFKRKSAGYYYAATRYPVFLGTSKLAAYANQAIEIGIQNRVGYIQRAGFRRLGQVHTAESCWLGFDMSVAVARPDIISVYFTCNSFAGVGTSSVSGAATFGWRRGKPARLGLDDIFHGPESSIDILSQVVSAQPNVALNIGRIDLATTTRNWYWYLDRRRRIDVLIAPPNHAPPSESPIIVYIPLSQLSRQVDTQGPLRAYLAG